MKKQLIVADSSPLITLLNINHIGWLKKLFTQIIIPPEVASEIAHKEEQDSIWFSLQESGFIHITELHSRESLPLLLLQIDPGEAEAIILAAQLDLPLLIDDKAGRKMAQMMGIKITGLVGILEALKHQGEISVQDIPEILEALENAEFRMSDSLKQLLLNQENNNA